MSRFVGVAPVAAQPHQHRLDIAICLDKVIEEVRGEVKASVSSESRNLVAGGGLLVHFPVRFLNRYATGST
jgi:hypothetical protein